MSDAPLFLLKGVHAVFDGATVISVEELDLEEGRVTVLVGENGSGKTTLLRLLNRLIAPADGTIAYRGRELGADGAIRAESVMLHQVPLLFRGSVLQNVAFGLKIRGAPREERNRRSAEALSRVGLAGLERRRVSTLSGGERQRVALARALVLAPKVLLLDEPTASVDPDSRVFVENAIHEASASGTTVIMSTHSMELAYRLCDRLVRLEAGRIIAASENILKGAVEATDELFTYFRTGSVLLRCPARAGNFVVAVLSMDELILSPEPLQSSARNQLAGKVTLIEPVDHLLRVTVDCGIALQALVTPAAARELGVETGGDCVVTFKASAVRLF
ncbi:MAG TPA: ATP-binding cassette domain-containing protein [Spirochaetia bacterium]|nr:ATP-binding cassette domain-containing protein [Spirochaetia bacterium]